MNTDICLCHNVCPSYRNNFISEGPVCSRAKSKNDKKNPSELEKTYEIWKQQTRFHLSLLMEINGKCNIASTKAVIWFFSELKIFESLG